MPPIIRKPTKMTVHWSRTVHTAADGTVTTTHSSPKINRGRKLPTPYRGTFDVRLMGDGSPDVFQKYEGTIVGPFGVAKVHGEWTVTLIAVKRKTAEGVPVKSQAGAVALALALSHLPWHVYVVNKDGTLTRTAAVKQLEADYLKILKSRSEWA